MEPSALSRDAEDASKSRKMVQKDIDSLRSQLEGLTGTVTLVPLGLTWKNSSDCERERARADAAQRDADEAAGEWETRLPAPGK
eukprot:747314-Hanusia_phi.AAC.14